MSAPTAPMFAPPTEADPAEAMADVDMPDAKEEPTSLHQIASDTNPAQATADDSEAETDIASTQNTPVKARSNRPGHHFSLDDTSSATQRPSETSFLSAFAAARKRKADRNDANDDRGSRSPNSASNSANLTIKQSIQSPELTATDAAGPPTATSSELSEHDSRAVTPVIERPTSSLLVQARPHLTEALSGGSRAGTEPRVRSRSPSQIRTSHRRSSSFHSAAAAAASVAERERRTRNRTSLEGPGSHESTPVPGRARVIHSNSDRLSMPSPMARYKDGTGRTPLAQACDKGEFEKVEELLVEKPDYLNEPDFAGTNPIQMAAIKGHVKIVKLLIDAGAKKDVCNKEGDTPLIDAVMNSHAEVVKLLLDSQVDPWEKNHAGKWAHELIPEDSDDEEKIKEMLVVACQKWNETHPRSAQPTIRPPVPPSRSLHFVELNTDKFIDFAEDGDFEGVSYMQNSGVRITNDCLVAAARGGHLRTMIIMLKHADLRGLPYDPDPTMVDETPMLAAIERGNYGVIKELLHWNKHAFDARRLINGKTYYEIVESMVMKPPGWEERYDMLRRAYEGEYEEDHNRDTPKPPEVPSKYSRLMTGKEKNEQAAHQRRSSDVSSRADAREEYSANPDSRSREAKEKAKISLGDQAKAELEAQEEARQRKVARAWEAQQKIQRMKAKAEQGARSPVNNRSPVKRIDDTPSKPKLEQEPEPESMQIDTEVEEPRLKDEATRQEESQTEQARLAEEVEKRKAAEREQLERTAREQREHEEARIAREVREEEERRAEAARKEEARLAEVKRLEEEAEAARLRAEEDARIEAEERKRLEAEEAARLRAEEEARIKAVEDRKVYLASLPRTLGPALSHRPVQSVRLTSTNGIGGQHHDYILGLENHWQPLPLVRGSDILGDDDHDDTLYIPGFFASVYLRHSRLDTVREDLKWSTLPCPRAQRLALWRKAGIGHALSKDHDWAIAPPEVQKDCGVEVYVDICGVAQVDWLPMWDEAQIKWLDLDDSQSMWVRLEDFIEETKNKEWLRDVRIRTSQWFTLRRRGEKIPTPVYVNGEEEGV